MPDVPHFDLPFRWDSTGHVAVVEQDSVDDVANCVEAVVRTRVGERDEHPNFGSPERLFGELPVTTEELRAAIERWEPRAGLLIEAAPDRLDDLLTRVRIRVRTEG